MVVQVHETLHDPRHAVLYMYIINYWRMKKIVIALFALLIITELSAQSAQTEDFLYAIKDTDTLYLTKYECASAQRKIEGARPAVIFVFGGGFFTGSRNAEYFQDYITHLTEGGYTLFTIDYRLGLKKYYEAIDAEKIATGKAPKKSYVDFIKALKLSVDMAVEDLFSATAFILSRAQEWNIDTASIVVSGSSAGAITALQSEYYICNWRSGGKTQPWDEMVAILPENFNYAGVVSYAGAIMNIDSKLEWNTPSAPMALFHGDIDPTVPYNRIWVPMVGKLNGSKKVAESLDKAGTPYMFFTYNKQKHNIASEPMNSDLELLDFFLHKLVKEKKPLVVNSSINDLSIKKMSKRQAKRDAKKENEAYQSGDHSFGRENKEKK